jgi:hypothetical protein
LLRLADYTTVIETQFDEVAGWPAGELDRFLNAGLLKPSESAHSLVCEECGEIEDVVLMESIVSPPLVPYLRCGLVGPYRIGNERLQRWQMSITQLIDAAFRSLELVGSREEIARMRMWRLGRARWAGTQWTIYFGRAMHCRDAWQIINQAAMPVRSVLFAPSKAIQADIRIERMPVMFGLDTVLSWMGNDLHFDHAQVEQHLAVELKAGETLPAAKPIPKRGSRTALIESLRRELEEHLRSARDYAEETLDRTGSPDLLPRPTMEFLARRQGVSKSTVSRCLEDASAGELRLLWDVAADLDRLMSAAGCH